MCWKGSHKARKDLDLECTWQMVLGIWASWPTWEGTMCKLARTGWVECVGGLVARSRILKKPRRYCLGPSSESSPTGTRNLHNNNTTGAKHIGLPDHALQSIKTVDDSQARKTHNYAHFNIPGKPVKPKLCFEFHCTKYQMTLRDKNMMQHTHKQSKQSIVCIHSCYIKTHYT